MRPAKDRVSWVGKFTIETWYNAATKSYVTQTKDSEDNQIGDASYAGNRMDSIRDHSFHLADAHKKSVTKVLPWVDSPSVTI